MAKTNLLLITISQIVALHPYSLSEDKVNYNNKKLYEKLLHHNLIFLPEVIVIYECVFVWPTTVPFQPSVHTSQLKNLTVLKFILIQKRIYQPSQRLKFPKLWTLGQNDIVLYDLSEAAQEALQRFSNNSVFHDSTHPKVVIFALFKYSMTLSMLSDIAMLIADSLSHEPWHVHLLQHNYGPFWQLFFN
jgi:hypothetical protein